MKKILAILLVCSLALSLSGCDLVEGLLNNAFQNAGGNRPGESAGGDAPALPQELLDLSEAKVVGGVYQNYYVFNGVTEAQVQAFAQTLLDAGYIRQSMTMELDNCPEANYMYRVYHTNANGPAPMAQFCFYKDTLVLCLEEIGMNLGEMWLAAGVEEAVFEADFPLFTPEEAAQPDWDKAEPVEIGGYQCKVLTDVTWRMVENYGLWLLGMGGRISGGGFDNLTVTDKIYANLFLREGVQEESYPALMWANGTALLVEVPADAQWNEYVLWDYLGADVVPGENYLMQYMLFVKPNEVGSGHGSSTGTVVWSYAPGCSTGDYEYYKGKITQMGFVEEIQETVEGDYREYVAVMYAPVGKRLFHIYYQIILDGDYLELELDYSLHEGHHKD